MKSRPLFIVLLLGSIGIAVFIGYASWRESSVVSRGSGASPMAVQASSETCSRSTREKIGNSVIESDHREIFGYESEIPLRDAVATVNDTIRCGFRDYSLLTEDEVIAAIVAGADYGKQGEIWSKQRDILWRIVIEKRLPISSLLVVTTGPRILDSPLVPKGTIAAKGITITLILNIDANHGLMKPPASEDTLVIRKTYSGIERVD